MSSQYTLDPDRFWSRVDKSGECWLWTGEIASNGYGRFRVSATKREQAHRIAYALTFGFISPGTLIRHRCDNPQCVRPEHLLPGTSMDNKQDALDRNRVPRGDDHYTKRTPERIRRGTDAPGAKLSRAQIAELLTYYDNGANQTWIARKFGVSRITIWRHIKARDGQK